jgi:hypothetical protein
VAAPVQCMIGEVTAEDVATITFLLDPA